MKKYILTMVVGLLMVSGCSVLQGTKPESVNQSFYLAYALVQSGYDSIQIAIQGGHVTTQSQANKLKLPLDQAKQSLDTAKAVWDAGDDFDAGVFDVTRNALLALQQTLLTLGGEANRQPVIPPDATVKLFNPLGATS
jgi:hypothetical protein